MAYDKVYSPHDVILNNLMGGNIGNWLYQYSLYRALMTDENVAIDAFDFNKNSMDKDFIDRVNEQYDAFILPLANAFKLSFKEELIKLTDFISKLKIPCIVIGIGIQCKLGKDFSQAFELSDLAKKFIKTVLEKSAIIGLRGENTAEFFKSLGFKEDVDYTIIGCPSMYMHGAHLPEPSPFVYSDDKLYSYNSKVEHENNKIISLLGGFTKEHSNYVYVPQRLGDIIRCYYGMDYRKNYITPLSGDRFFNEKNAVCFANVPSWINYMKENVDFSIGTRIHGNVAAVLAGVPSLIIANDQRVAELAQYHNIPFVTIDKINKKDTIEHLTDGVDFSSVNKGHRERFNHFVDFLEKNGLNTAYSKNRDVKEVYFDQVQNALDFSTDVLAFKALNNAQKIKRTQDVAVFYATELRNSNLQIKKLKAENQKLKTEAVPKAADGEEAKASDKKGFFSKFFK
ncbi:MAG: polysaccharide pyruvyl transferase family protein [Acutalibacteraceae bacterium]